MNIITAQKHKDKDIKRFALKMIQMYLKTAYLLLVSLL